MSEKEYLFILKFLKREILTDVDRGLYRAVNSLYEENRKLTEKILDIGGKEMAQEFWSDWAEQDW